MLEINCLRAVSSFPERYLLSSNSTQLSDSLPVALIRRTKTQPRNDSGIFSLLPLLTSFSVRPLSPT